MQYTGLWKYCTTEQCKELLLSYHLFGNSLWTENRQISCLYALSNHAEKHYRTASLPKKDGSTRLLLIPDPLLGTVQKNILNNILSELPLSNYATAYRTGMSITDNARAHINQKIVLKLDITDFFGSIEFPMVLRNAFSSLYFPPSVGTLLTYLCCYKDCLPQGAPTSPAISNLIMKPFDTVIGSWCAERAIAYTRYCDDLTFSGDFNIKLVKNKVKSYLEELGFTLNDKKTKVLFSSARQEVTGIVTNKKPQTPAVYRRELRQELYYCKKYGVKDYLKFKNSQADTAMAEPDALPYLYSLFGRIQFVLYVNPEDISFAAERDIVKEWLTEAGILHQDSSCFVIPGNSIT